MAVRRPRRDIRSTDSAQPSKTIPKRSSSLPRSSPAGSGPSAPRRAPSPGPSTRRPPRAPAPGDTTTANDSASPRSGNIGRRFTAARFDKHAAANLLSSHKKQGKTNFGKAYAKGTVPCRIAHGAVNLNIKWDTELESLDYDPLLVLCAEGIGETEHPFVFLARRAFQELLQAVGAAEKAIPLLPQVVPHLRTWLSSADKSTFLAALEAVGALAQAVGPALVEYLHVLLPPMSRKMFQPGMRERIEEVLRKFQDYCGPEANPKIKAKIPTFSMPC